jgi:hypothetical protein
VTEFLKITVEYQFLDGHRKRKDPTASGWRLRSGFYFNVTEDIRK